MTNDDIDRILDNMRKCGICSRDAGWIVALARRGLRAERETCGAWRAIVRERDEARADAALVLGVLTSVAHVLGVDANALAEDPSIAAGRRVSAPVDVEEYNYVAAQAAEAAQDANDLAKELQAVKTELAEAQATIDRLTRERDEARTKYEWMVEHAADQKLDGYRELGARCAELERERDEARAVLRDLRSRAFGGRCAWCGFEACASDCALARALGERP
jgi:hypothetical protein